MITYAAMGVLVLAIALITVWGFKYSPEKDSFLSKGDAIFFRGFWCIIVVLVHIPAVYQNRIQDMIGSFGYIGVTFFFLTSAFGIKNSIAHKENYMDRFWRNRIPGLLIPAFFVAVIIVIGQVIAGLPETIPAMLYNSMCWLIVLLLFYFVVWAVYFISLKVFKQKEGHWQDAVICLIVLAFSLIDRFTDVKITLIWIVEPLGFAYGIMAACNSEKIKQWIAKKWLAKVIVLFILSVALGLMYLKFKPVPVFGDYLLKIVLGMSLTMLIFQATGKIKVGNKANNFLGNISYEIFLIHGFVLDTLAILFKDRSDLSGLYICSSLVVTVIMAVIIDRLSRPLIKRLKKS